MTELFTYVTCTYDGHKVEQHYLSKSDADKLFDKMSAENSNSFVAYYCASIGGLVNAHYAL